jgi:hypothetical protein
MIDLFDVLFQVCMTKLTSIIHKDLALFKADFPTRIIFKPSIHSFRQRKISFEIEKHTLVLWPLFISCQVVANW